MNPTRVMSALALVLLATRPVSAQTVTPDSAYMAGMRWRPIGPANMSGRITDIEGLPSPSRTFYVAAAAGGIWKTTNGGTTFRPLFQKERVVSMGDLAIAPSDSMQVWAGTGEEDSRNSHSPAGGVYKSTDAGMNWTLMGLEKTEHVGRIVVHPSNPNVVYVAALGAAWRSNPERGLYKTDDGGKTWKLIKFISDKAGFVDIAMDPTNPDVLFAASWERVRGPYFLNSGGPGSALWKSTDAGSTWTEVKGGGFPATVKGRIGLAIAPSDNKVIYALVEAAAPTGKSDGCRTAMKGGCGLYRSSDGGATWEWMNGNDVRPFYYSQVRVDVKNPNRVYWSSTPVNFSNDGGKTIGTTTLGLHVDHHAMWLDANDADHFIVGNDGGIGITWDKGGTYDFVSTMPLGQFYNISFDMRMPYYVCGGLQDNGSWCGPSRRSSGSISNAEWFKIGGGDGFHTAQDPKNWNIVYYESQGGNMSRTDLLTGQRTSLRKPSWLDRYREFEDSIVIQRGDTAQAITPPLRTRLQQLRGAQLSDSIANALRWNWNTPFFLSPHNSNVFYAASSRVMKSEMRGDSIRAISADLSDRDTMKIRVSTQTTGGVTSDVTQAETYGTIVSLAESPLRAGVLYAGTDDGNVWLSPDDGKTWTDLTARFAKLVPANTYVSRIEPSRVEVNRWYITFDNHRNGDFTPYVLATTDGGKTFRSIAANLPRGGPDFVHVLREDPVNPDLLYLGTDVGLYVSLDRGASWTKFMNGLPTTPVHDLKVHPRDRELIAGTHGRSIWVVDVAPLQQYRAQLVAAADPQLLELKPALAYMDPQSGGEGTGHKVFLAQSPQFGAEITYWVPSAPAAVSPATPVTGTSNGNDGTPARPQGQRAAPRAQIFVLNAAGDTISRINGPATRGLQRVFWDLRKPPQAVRPLSPAEKRDSALLEPRIAFVVDSLVKQGYSRESIDRSIERFREIARTGSFGGGLGSGSEPIATGGPLSGALGVQTDRPGETPPRAAGGAGGAAAGGGRTLTNDDARALSSALRLPGRPVLRSVGGGFGATQLIDEGKYNVVLKIGDKTSTTTVTVVKPQ